MNAKQIENNILKSIIKNVIKREANKILQEEISAKQREVQRVKNEWAKKDRERNYREAQYSSGYIGHVRYDWGRHNRELHMYGYGKGY